MTDEYFTEAIVLDKEPLGEQDEQIYLFTKDLGKITAKAVSARKITSKLACHLQPGKLVQVRLVQKNRFQVVDALERGVIAKDSAALAVLRLVKDLAGEGEADLELWKTLIGGRPSGQSVLGALGFGGQFAVCENCGNNRPSHFLFQRLEYYCGPCFAKSGKPDAFALI